MDDDVSSALVKKAIAKHCLLGWKNLLDEQDKEIEFSQEKALDLLNESEDFFTDIFEYCNDSSMFRKVDDEESLGN